MKTQDIGREDRTHSFIGNTKTTPYFAALGPVVSVVTKRGSKGNGTKDGDLKGTVFLYQNKDDLIFVHRHLASKTKTQEASSDDEKILTYTSRSHQTREEVGTPDGLKIIQYVFEKNIDLRKSLRVGMYSALSYHYNPVTQLVSAYRYSLRDEIESSEKLGSEDKIQVFGGFGGPSRVFFSVNDNGVLSSNGGEEESGRDRGDCQVLC